MDFYNNNTDWPWFPLEDLQQPTFVETIETPCISQPNSTTPDDTSENSSNSSDTCCEEVLDTHASNPRKRRQTSESSESDALKRSRKSRKLQDPQQTAKVREKGACFCCQKKRKPVRSLSHQFFKNPIPWPS